MAADAREGKDVMHCLRGNGLGAARPVLAKLARQLIVAGQRPREASDIHKKAFWDWARGSARPRHPRNELWDHAISMQMDIVMVR